MFKVCFEDCTRPSCASPVDNEATRWKTSSLQTRQSLHHGCQCFGRNNDGPIDTFYQNMANP